MLKRNSIVAVRLFTLAAALAMAPAVLAQAVSIASVNGRVADEQGASVAGAQIRMTGVETGSVSTAVNNADGVYTIPSLAIGAYTLQATSAGFQTYVQNGILLRVGDQVQINIDMKVGSVSERVEVQASAALVQTQQSSISQVVDQQRIVDLPLNGRDPTQLITISGASTKSSATNGRKSSSPSPTPMNRTGMGCALAMAAITTTASRT